MKIYSIYNKNKSYDWMNQYKDEGHEVAIIGVFDPLILEIEGIPAIVDDAYKVLSFTKDPVILTDSYKDIKNIDFKNRFIVNQVFQEDKKLLVFSIINIPKQVYFYEYFQERLVYDVGFIFASQEFWEQVRRIYNKWIVHNFIENKNYNHELICNFCLSFYEHKVSLIER